MTIANCNTIDMTIANNNINSFFCLFVFVCWLTEICILVLQSHKDVHNKHHEGKKINRNSTEILKGMEHMEHRVQDIYL